MRSILSILVLILLIACGPQPQTLPERHFIPGLAMPLKLLNGQQDIQLADFVPDPSGIDSVSLAGKTFYPSEKATIAVMAVPEMPAVMEMRIYCGDSWQSVPVFNNRTLNHSFVFDPQGADYKEVSLAADFNGWTPSRTPLVNNGGLWTATLPLDPGRYQYQVVADGRWSTDPGNPDSADNNNGGYNSVLKIGLQDRSPLPMIFLTESEPAQNELVIGFSGQAPELMVLWQNFVLGPSYLEQENDEVSIRIPAEAEQIKRSFIRVYSWNSLGTGNDLLIPLESGKVITAGGQLDRSDLNSQIIYNVFIDRFFSGDSLNDEPIADPSLVHPRADYHGGDIRGITAKIRDGYFEELGVNTLWISPVVLNPKGAYGFWKNPPTKFSAYHGYWPISFTLIDPRLGTPEDLKEMVNAAHAAGMNVLLDFVAHHVHELHPYFQKYPDRTTSLYLPDGTLNTEKWDEHRLTTWFDVFLPTLDLQNPEVTEMLSDSAVWWIREYQLDGFRHDATKHVPEIFWRSLTRKLVGSGMLDSQFDFNVYDAALGAFARPDDPFTNLASVLQTSFDYYGFNNQMGYITGNQDRGRFTSYAGGDLKFSENAKEAGWTRDIGVGDSIAYRRLAMLHAFNMTIPGVPVIYYGDEFGMPGGNDPDSRRMMKFDNLNPLERDTRETASRLAGLRQNNLSMIFGNFVFLRADNETLAYARKYLGQESVIIFNKKNQASDITLDLPSWMKAANISTFNNYDVSLENRRLGLVLPAWSFEIVTFN